MLFFVNLIAFFPETVGYIEFRADTFLYKEEWHIEMFMP